MTSSVKELKSADFMANAHCIAGTLADFKSIGGHNLLALIRIELTYLTKICEVLLSFYMPDPLHCDWDLNGPDR